METVSMVITAVGALTIVTNIITQVIKQVTPEKMPTNLLALIVGMALTLAAGFAYTEMYNIAVTWYIVTGEVIGGFMVAFSAMFGFDKFKELMKGGKNA